MTAHHQPPSVAGPTRLWGRAGLRSCRLGSHLLPPTLGASPKQHVQVGCQCPDLALGGGGPGSVLGGRGTSGPAASSSDLWSASEMVCNKANTALS